MADESANELIPKKNNKIRCLAPLTFLFNEQIYDYTYIYTVRHLNWDLLLRLYLNKNVCFSMCKMRYF